MTLDCYHTSLKSYAIAVKSKKELHFQPIIVEVGALKKPMHFAYELKTTRVQAAAGYHVTLITAIEKLHLLSSA